jgi:hypothetical protein
MMSSTLIPSPTFAHPHIFINPTAHNEVAKRKKKKRQHEDNDDQHDGPEKKKKRKKQVSEQADAQNVVDPALLSSLPSEAAPVKRKRKKKDKEKQPAAAPSAEPAQPEDDVNPQAAAAALISAIVAAATSSPEYVQEPPQPYPPQLPYMLPHPAQPQFMPYPFNPYPYGDPAYMPTNALPTTVFPPTMNLPFSEMTFGSNDDVLRALQALDMSKITNVLKTLGDAAAVMSGQSATGEQARPTPLGQVPVASGAILGHASNESSSAPRHKRTLDMSLAGVDQTNPDHAYLLANKWLNASKLTELARNEGISTLLVMTTILTRV